MNSIKPPRVLFCATLAFLLMLASSTYYFAKSKLPPSITIETKGQPTLGYAKARVHVVIFEEPKCSHCRELNNELFPIIKKEFIDTNKISYTIVPVSFMPGSMPAAIAALCIYHQNTLYPNDELFFKFFDYMYQHQPDTGGDWATTQTLVDYAHATSPAIQLEQLQKCVEMENYRVQIEQNTAYAKEIMGGSVATPTIYVNGIMAQDMSPDAIRSLINTVLEHEGIY